MFLKEAARCFSKKVQPWIVPIAVLVLWQASSRYGWLSSRILPEPLAVVKAGIQLALSGELWRHVWVSAFRALG
ncbi:MAG: ABC transporter permease, partial [Candidatus Accumulibacter sp.]|nr:ABC transporter permease [Accumulibacter sp.]